MRAFLTATIFSLVALSSVACSSTVVGRAPEPEPAPPAPGPPPSAAIVEAADLFTVSDAEVSDGLFGVWAREGAAPGEDVRLLLTKTSIMVARRCGSGADRVMAAVEVSAHTREDSIAVLASAADTKEREVGAACEVTLVATQVRRCGSYPSSECFHTPDGGLVFIGGRFFPNSTWVKVSD